MAETDPPPASRIIRSQRGIPPRGHCPKPQTPRKTCADKDIRDITTARKAAIQAGQETRKLPNHNIWPVEFSPISVVSETGYVSACFGLEPDSCCAQHERQLLLSRQMLSLAAALLNTRSTGARMPVDQARKLRAVFS